MKVKELIEILKAFPPEMEVISYEYGFFNKEDIWEDGGKLIIE